MLRPALIAFAFAPVLTFAPLSAGGAQQITQPTMSKSEIAALARTQFAINAAVDSSNVQLSKQSNKKPEVQEALRTKRKENVAEILHHAGLTDAQFRSQTYLVSVDTGYRRTFDSVMVTLTGQALP